MTLATLHARFLHHCAVEKRLRPMTIKSYRSDFGLFLQLLRRRSKTLSPQGRGQGEGPGRCQKLTSSRCGRPARNWYQSLSVTATKARTAVC